MMLRVGLTGELGSGKSTVARLLAEHGAIVLSSDEMGRAMMQRGEPVFHAIIEQFGPGVMLQDGTLNRRELARLAFDLQHPRVEELNAIVHPAVLAKQERRIAEIAREQPEAIVVIESALIFNTRHAGDGEPWGRRFDQIVVVTAPEELKIARFIERSAASRHSTESERMELRRDAQTRLAAQRIPAEVVQGCLVIENSGELATLAIAVDAVWTQLVATESR